MFEINQNKKRSKEDQNNIEINFDNLRKAEPYPTEGTSHTDLVSVEKLRADLPDKAITYLNSFTEKGYLLPLEQMNLILKKFQNHRYGKVWQAEELYRIISNKLHRKDINYGSQYESQFDTYYEMMEVYVRRLPKKSNHYYGQQKEEYRSKLKDIFQANNSPQTVCALMHFYNAIDEAQEAIVLFQNSDWKNDWIDEAYRTAVIKIKGPKEAGKEFGTSDNKIEGNRTIIITLRNKNVKEAEEYFDSLREDQKQDEYIRRELLKIYSKKPNSDNISKIKKFFSETPNKIELTYNHMIKILCKAKEYDEAYKVYKEACANKCYKENQPKLAENSNEILQVDLHSRVLMGGGGPSDPVALNKGVITVIIRSLFERFYEYGKEGLSIQQIHIICGQGENGVTKQFVKTYLCDQYGLVDNQVSNKKHALLELNVTPELSQKLLRSFQNENDPNNNNNNRNVCSSIGESRLSSINNADMQTKENRLAGEQNASRVGIAQKTTSKPQSYVVPLTRQIDTSTCTTTTTTTVSREHLRNNVNTPTNRSNNLSTSSSVASLAAKTMSSALLATTTTPVSTVASTNDNASLSRNASNSRSSRGSR